MHDEIIEAFRTAFPQVRLCHRGDPINGYTHVHGPSQLLNLDGLHQSHTVVVEKLNGTVALAGDLATLMGAVERPALPIHEHPLGYSAGPNYGRFWRALSAATIRAEWPTLDGFVEHLVNCATMTPEGW